MTSSGLFTHLYSRDGLSTLSGMPDNYIRFVFLDCSKGRRISKVSSDLISQIFATDGSIGSVEVIGIPNNITSVPWQAPNHRALQHPVQHQF